MLGSNFTLGSRIPDRSGKFLLCINNLSRDRLLSFLPNGLNFIPLTLFVAFILRDQLARDLRLGFAPDQAGGMVWGGRKTPCWDGPVLSGSRSQNPASLSMSGRNQITIWSQYG